MWWAFISLCNSRCPWSRSQGGIQSNNRIAPSELKEYSDSPPDYDTVLGNRLKPMHRGDSMILTFHKLLLAIGKGLVDIDSE